MSAESIARWNAIPLTRPENPGLSTLSSVTKRPRDDEEYNHDEENELNGDGSDDDVSLVSRSPSPVPQDQMDIDKYDDYVRGPVREVITTETKIKNTNKGFMMLSKLGWVEGQCLGLSQDARIDPIPFRVKNDATGLGKTSQDFRMIETTVSQRRELDSERQRNETEEQRKAREGNVARRAALQTEISEVLRPFYCTVCEKQFQNVAQYDEHTNSYAHHHKIRFREMQNAQRAKQNTAEEQDKRKEKERKREEKELRKIAAAAGVRVAKTTTSSTVAIAPAASSSSSTDSKPSGFKKGIWASISSANAEQQPPPSSAESPPARTGGWASVGPSSSSVPSHSASPPAPDATSSSGGFMTTTDPAWSSQVREPSIPSVIREQQATQEPGQRQLHQPAPAFRTGGWSSIDSTTRLPPPPPLPPQLQLPSAAPPIALHQDTTPPTSATPTANVRGQPGHRPSGSTSASVNVPAAIPSPVPVPPRPQDSIANPDPSASKPSKSKKKEKEAEMRENSRSGWQTFQKGGRRK